MYKFCFAVNKRGVFFVRIVIIRVVSQLCKNAFQQSDRLFIYLFIIGGEMMPLQQ